jgi:transposase-like protein
MNSRKVIRPSKEELEELIWKFPMTALAKQFGVSDKAIAKWVKNYELNSPGVGYWNKH